MESLKSKLEELFCDALFSGVAITKVEFDISEIPVLRGPPKIVIEKINIDSFLVDCDKKAP